MRNVKFKYPTTIHGEAFRGGIVEGDIFLLINIVVLVYRGSRVILFDLVSKF